MKDIGHHIPAEMFLAAVKSSLWRCHSSQQVDADIMASEERTHTASHLLPDRLTEIMRSGEKNTHDPGASRWKLVWGRRDWNSGYSTDAGQHTLTGRGIHSLSDQLAGKIFGKHEKKKAYLAICLHPPYIPSALLFKSFGSLTHFCMGKFQRLMKTISNQLKVSERIWSARLKSGCFKRA